MKKQRKLQNALRFLFSRVVIVGVLLFLQAAVLVGIIWKFQEYFVWLFAVNTAISLLTTLYILNSSSNPNYKLAWIIPILLFPVFGGPFYLLFGQNRLSRRGKAKLQRVASAMAHLRPASQPALQALEQLAPAAANQSRYISQWGGCPLYQDTWTQYLPLGQVKFQRLLEELKKAEHFIFLEYFIIQEGVMWDAILEVLREKAAAGVDVRVIYDDVGCLMTLPTGYDKKLEAMGIRCCVFNPFRPVLDMRMNNRDHRKIAVIDGHTGFTGGINLADEYINAYPKHGYWKDTAILLRGEAVWNLTVMFLSMWGYLRGVEEDYEPFRPHAHHPAPFEGEGFVQPYCDNPLDGEAVGQTVYMNLIGKAQRYMYITTPYLVIDDGMITALTNAAKAGVDVRIITPHIPDKWYVHAVSRANYNVLIRGGVKIYEYTPGFVHAKTFVADDLYATVGTVNLDYRSLFLHFECGVWMYATPSVLDIKRDYLQTLESCQLMPLIGQGHLPPLRRLGRAILRAFAPLM